jgi:hypothetical protein
MAKRKSTKGQSMINKTYKKCTHKTKDLMHCQKVKLVRTTSVLFIQRNLQQRDLQSFYKQLSRTPGSLVKGSKFRSIGMYVIIGDIIMCLTSQWWIIFCIKVNSLILTISLREITGSMSKLTIKTILRLLVSCGRLLVVVEDKNNITSASKLWRIKKILRLLVSCAG